MSYVQNLTGCLPENDFKAFQQVLQQSTALEAFRTTFHNGLLAPLSLVNQTDDMSLYHQAAHQFSGFEDVLIFGTGGSSLGGKTLCALSSQTKPHLHFIDNIDPHTFSSLLKKINPTTTGLLVVSKSGSTAETLMQLLTYLQHRSNSDPSHVIVITEPTDNPLRHIAKSHDWVCLDHPLDVGGRYSCFSVVGLFPALLAGLDPMAFRKGGKDVLHHHLTQDCPPALEAAVMGIYVNKPLSVIMPYADELKSFAAWYCQLWAESLGKDGKGTTPLPALGTVDQHSQLQLYLNGPRDKFFTLLTLPWEGEGNTITSPSIPEFKGKTMGDLFAAELKATTQTLINNDCPTRLITLDRLDEYHLGALMMHFMIETILTATLLGVDAFNQPAVEEGKRLAKKYLSS